MLFPGQIRDELQQSSHLGRALASDTTLKDAHLCAETMVIFNLLHTSGLCAVFCAAGRGRWDPNEYLLAVVTSHMQVHAQNIY